MITFYKVMAVSTSQYRGETWLNDIKTFSEIQVAEIKF